MSHDRPSPQQGQAVPRVCPECGADTLPDRTHCWLCGAKLAGGSTTAAASAPAPPTFALTSLMLLITLVAVVLGVYTIAPGVAVLLVIAVVPALSRTFRVTRRREREGTPLRTRDKIGTFFYSTLLASVILVIVGGASAVAFIVGLFAACAADRQAAGWYSREARIAAVISAVALLTGLAIAARIAWKLWPISKKNRNLGQG